MEECKYRLPCDWCDKFNKKCEEVDYGLPNQDKCNHDWQLENIYAYCDSSDNKVRHRAKYVCRKCYVVEVREVDKT